MPLYDVRLRFLDGRAKKVIIDNDPSDRVSAPVEPREVLQNRRVHGDQHPVTVAPLVYAPDNVGIGSTFGFEIGDRLDHHPPIFKRKDQAMASELLVKDESGHSTTPIRP